MHSIINFKQLIEAVSDAIIVCNASGDITLWNPAAERMFGFTESEALGQSLNLIIPERQRQRHWNGYHKTMHTGQTRYGNEVLQVPALHKNGSTLSIAFTVAMMYSAEKTVTAIVAVIRNETSRRKEEQNLRQRLEQLEGKIG